MEKQYPKPTGHNAATKPVSLPNAPATSRYSMPSSQRQESASEKQERGIRAFKKLMTGRPDFGKGEPPEYAVGMAESLAALTPEELAWVMDPREGVNARCKFLPTMADVMELVREKHAKADQFRSGNSGYNRFGPADDPEQAPAEIRKAAVKAFWRDPDEPAKRTRHEDMIPPTAAEMNELSTGMKLKLPTKSDATPQLLELVRRQSEEEKDVRWS